MFLALTQPRDSSSTSIFCPAGQISLVIHKNWLALFVVSLLCAPISICTGTLSSHLASLYMQWLCFLVGTGLCTKVWSPITCKLLVADFDNSVKCTLSYWLAALQYFSCVHSAFDGNSTSLQHRPVSLKGLCAVLSAPTQRRYRHTN